MSVAFIQVHLRPDFIIEANTMNPDQTDLGPCFLQCRLPKKISKQVGR